MKSFETLIGTTTRATLQQDYRIKRVISRIVPVSTLDHIEFCRLEGGRLRLTVDSAAWVARLRFSERHIIDILRQERLDIHTVSFHVSPAEEPAVRTTRRKPNGGSDAAARALAALANTVDSVATEPQGGDNAAAVHSQRTAGRKPTRANAARKKRHQVESQNARRLRYELLKLAKTLRQS